MLNMLVSLLILSVIGVTGCLCVLFDSLGYTYPLILAISSVLVLIYLIMHGMISSWEKAEQKRLEDELKKRGLK
jgi:hypothetical protein